MQVRRRQKSKGRVIVVLGVFAMFSDERDTRALNGSRRDSALIQIGLRRGFRSLACLGIGLGALSPGQIWTSSTESRTSSSLSGGGRRHHHAVRSFFQRDFTSWTSLILSSLDTTHAQALLRVLYCLIVAFRPAASPSRVYHGVIRRSIQ